MIRFDFQPIIRYGNFISNRSYQSKLGFQGQKEGELKSHSEHILHFRFTKFIVEMKSKSNQSKINNSIKNLNTYKQILL